MTALIVAEGLRELNIDIASLTSDYKACEKYVGHLCLFEDIILNQFVWLAFIQNADMFFL